MQTTLKYRKQYCEVGVGQFDKQRKYLKISKKHILESEQMQIQIEK